MLAASREDAEHFVVASALAYFDESGKFKDHKIISFCGFVAGFDPWIQFGPDWEYWLRNVGLKGLHVAQAFNIRRPLSGRHAAKDIDSRIRELSKFLLPIKAHIELGIVQVIDVDAFNALPSEIKRSLGNNPHYLVFRRAVTDLVKHISIKPNATVSIICDDEEQYSVECYKLLCRMKQEDPNIRKCVVCLCFGDDNYYSQLQAADLLSGLCRLEALRRFKGEQFPLQPLYKEMMTGDPKSGLTWETGFWSAEALKSLSSKMTSERRST